MPSPSVLALAAASALSVSACGARSELVGAATGAEPGLGCAGDGIVELASVAGAGKLAVDATSIYIAVGPGIVPPGQGGIVRVPKCGGAPVTLASGQAGPEDMVIDETHAYWTNPAMNGFGTLTVTSPARSSTTQRLPAPSGWPRGACSETGGSRR